jgi:hypothetical protein
MGLWNKVLTFSNPHFRYEGKFENNLMHGEGLMIWPDSTYYQGSFKKNGIHGEGVYTDREGIRLYGYVNKLFLI